MEWLTRQLTPERARFLRFCFVGLSGVVVNLGVFSVASRLLLGAFPDADDRFTAANVAGFLVSVLTNFLLNEFWTFGDRALHRSHTQLLRRLVKFYLVASLAGLVQIGVARLARSELQLVDHVAVLCGIALATVINFIANNVWTFRVKRPKTAAPGAAVASITSTPPA